MNFWSKEDYLAAIELSSKHNSNCIILDDEYKPKKAPDEYYDRENKYNKKANNLFFNGGTLTKKEMFKELPISNYLKFILSDWGYSHEDKSAIAGQILEYFFDI